MSKRSSKRKVQPSARSRTQKDDLTLPEELTFDFRALEGAMRQLMWEPTESGSQLEAAQQLMCEAFEESDPRRQMKLARKALEISPDCADAYVLLAEYASTLPEALQLYEQGVAAGERALGKKAFEEYAGHFWGFLETRPYMRAREALSDCLWMAGRREEAAEHCRDMLRLNPNDNQGIRYRLASMLLDLQQHDELEQLLEDYQDDSSPEWAYTRALLAFRLEGDSLCAHEMLLAATKVNPHVPAYIAGIKPMPRQMPEYITPGEEDEAVGYAGQFLPAWKETPGAVTWLRKALNLFATAQQPSKRQTWKQLRVALARLPQAEHETWQLDLRGVELSSDDELSDHWLLVVFNATSERVVHFDLFDVRPSDTEVWTFLTAAMQTPLEGEPCRPGTIRLTRKTWLRSWGPKLREISIDCQLSECLEQIDHWFKTTLKQLEKARQLVTESEPTEDDWSSLESLTQHLGEVWQAVVQRMPTWMEEDGELVRPWISMVADVDNDLILATCLLPDERPDDLLLSTVWQAIRSPAAGEPHRPGVIQVSTDEQLDILLPHLEPLGVRCVTADLEHIRRLFDDLTKTLGRQGLQALIRSPGVTPTQVGAFYEAAAHFYRARPWRGIPGDTIIQVDCDRFHSGPWFAVVMGQSGLEQGLVLYEDLQLLRQLLNNDISEEEMRRRTSAISVTYGEPFDVAPEDLDAAEANRWEVAGPEAYPCVLRVNPGLALRTPLPWELKLVEGCLRAIPDFISRQAVKTEIPLNVSGDLLLMRLERLEDG